jgi:hypothetical protein
MDIWGLLIVKREEGKGKSEEEKGEDKSLYGPT